MNPQAFLSQRAEEESVEMVLIGPREICLHFEGHYCSVAVQRGGGVEFPRQRVVPCSKCALLGKIRAGGGHLEEGHSWKSSSANARIGLAAPQIRDPWTPCKDTHTPTVADLCVRLLAPVCRGDGGACVHFGGGPSAAFKQSSSLVHGVAAYLCVWGELCARTEAAKGFTGVSVARKPGYHLADILGKWLF